MSKLEKAIKMLKENYKTAIGNPDLIAKPLSWALYQTWKKFDQCGW